jgi:hypothetical protein
MIGQFPRRHRQEQSFIAINELHVPDHKRIVKSERAKCLQAAGAPATQVDPNFRQIHVAPREGKRPSLSMSSQIDVKKAARAAESDKQINKYAGLRKWRWSIDPASNAITVWPRLR